MATFSASGIPDPTPNVLFNAAGVNDAAQKTQANALGIQAAQLQNAYTAAVQPAQINALLGGMNMLSGGGGGPAQPQATPAAISNADADPISRIPAAQTGQISLFHGQMPVSADRGTQALVGDIAQQNGLNPEWAMRIHHAESGASKTPFGPGSTSSAGAIGPMQLMPGTAQGLGIDPHNLRGNISGGVSYLAQLKQQFGSPVLATAAYNAGPDRVNAFLSGKAPLPTETVNYVGKVFGADGPSLLNDALTGMHGPTAGHEDGVGTTSFQPPGTGMQQIPQDDAARQSIRQLLGLRQVALAQPNGAGMRAVGQIQQQLDNIAGPGGIVGNDGNVYRVPGSYATRYAAAQATKAGEAGPAAALYAQNEHVRQTGDQQTHAVNANIDLQKTLNTPTKLGPGEMLITPAAVGVGGAAAPGGFGATSASQPTGTTQAAAVQPQGGNFVIGDSIGQGVAQANGLPGVYKSGAPPQAVLGMINGLPANALQGRNVIISTGVSNAAGDTSLVQPQIDAAKAKGATNITLVGVGPHASYVKAGSNANLAALAQQNGVGFTGPLTNTGQDGVHPTNYRGLGLNAPATQTPAAATPAGLSSVTPQAAIQQATTELGPQLNIMSPTDANNAVMTRAQQIMGGQAAPSSAGPIAPTSQPGVYRAPVDPSIAAATEGAKQTITDYADVMKEAKEGAASLNRIAQVRQALSNASAAGLPPGALAEPISKGVAIAKYLGVDPQKVFGVDPAAVPNEQVAREGLTQLTGLLLKQIFPGRITDTDVRTYGSNFGNIAQDPAALDAILNQAQQVAQYGVDRGYDMLDYKAAHNDQTVGWDRQWYRTHGFAPNMVDAAAAKTAPAGPAQPSAQPGGSAGMGTAANPARPQTPADYNALPSRSVFINPRDGKRMVKP